ncbi:MOSC domain-containing protein [Pantoea cypripedii]|uniref:MOSC domain-containing protein n=1 Tax=Pantoea cypripedii TaxID=55209 RepID=UPI002FC83CD5
MTEIFSPIEPNHDAGKLKSGVVGLFTAEIAAHEMQPQSKVKLIAGVGIEGDRYAKKEGRWSDRPKPEHQLTLIAAEVLEDISLELGIEFTARECRRNIVTSGIALNNLVGKIVKIGESAIILATKPNHPCRYLERLIDKPVMESLLGRSGLNCEILRGGIVNIGDQIVEVTEEWRSDC